MAATSRLLTRLPASLLGTLCAALLAACNDAPAPAEPTVRTIAWARAEAVSGEIERVLPGRVRADTEATIGFDVGGRIEQLNVDIGDRFQAGNVLATLRSGEYREAVAQRRADVDAARARLQQARADHARQAKLRERGVVAEATYDRAAEALGTARAELDAAEARLATAREDLAETELLAPYAGAVARREAESGERVSAGQAVLAVQQNGGLRVRVAVPETLVGLIEKGQTHAIELPHSPGETVTATVARIGAGGNQGGLFPVDLLLADPSAALRPGMTASVRLRLPVVTADKGRIAIPLTAYMAGPGDTAYAFVFDEAEQVVRRRAVEIGHVTQERALVTAGLQAGEIVAAKGLAFLADGQRVRRLGVGIRRFASEPELPTSSAVLPGFSRPVRPWGKARGARCSPSYTSDEQRRPQGRTGRP